MFRTILSTALRTTTKCVSLAAATPKLQLLGNPSTTCISPISMAVRSYSTILPMKPIYPNQSTLLQAVKPTICSERSVTKFSLKKGKRKTVKSVLKRFKRLDWGCWIRTHSGREKKKFKKSPALKRRLRQHVFVNGTQSWLLDKMVTKYWRRPRHYINDPYRPYHSREEFFATRSKPIEY